MNSALWNSIISFLQRRSDNPSNEMDEPPWCLLLVKDPSSLDATIAEDEQSGSILNEMTYLQKRTWLSRIRICYTPTIHHLRAILSSMHIKQDIQKDINSLLPTLDIEHSDRAPSLVAVYNLSDIIEDESNYISTIQEHGSNNMTRLDDLMHILAALSELLEYFKSTSETDSHLVLYDTKLQHSYSAEIETEVVVPIALDLSPEDKKINTIYQAWTDWIVESDMVVMQEDIEGSQLEKKCISLVAIPSRRATATEDLHWTFEV
ncbi:unnamed protein product [Umbelopsis vinacea]